MKLISTNPNYVDFKPGIQDILYLLFSGILFIIVNEFLKGAPALRGPLQVHCSCISEGERGH